MVGTARRRATTRTRGLAIVNWLLARDAQGNVNSNARKLGIQQILFDDRCWNSDGDRGIASWTAMRPCGIGHHDHVHLDLTINGANGNVSYWGARAGGRAEARHPGVVGPATRPGGRRSRGGTSCRPTRRGSSLPAGYDQAIVGDWDSDGIQDEILLWDIHTGNWVAAELDERRLAQRPHRHRGPVATTRSSPATGTATARSTT